MKFNNKKIVSLSIILYIATGMLLAQVEGKREMRATWVASVSHIDWPAYEDRGNPANQKADLISKLELYQASGLNAIFLQVRPECDALYNSTYEYIENVTELNIDDFNQVLGYDRSIQSSVMFDFAERELEISTRSEWELKQSEIFELSKKYKLLLQLDSANSTNLEKFGGSSTIYFGIEPKDLKMRNFNNVIMVFQGT